MRRNIKAIDRLCKASKQVRLRSLILVAGFSLFYLPSLAQDDLRSILDSAADKKTEKVTGAFKSSRVINGHSIEFLGKKVLDVRILHRFGMLKDGIGELFGLDQASMRLGFDYGINNNLTIGVGRSTLQKELDGFLKYRLMQQSTGYKSKPVSIALVAGSTLMTAKFAADEKYTGFRYRLGYYYQAIVARKFSDAYSLQLSPTYVHRNLAAGNAGNNNVYSLGIGSRIKMSKRMAFVADYQFIFAGLNKETHHNPLSIGFDIETGGHVFQLHFSNATGMNEKAFITNTPYRWASGEIRFGFNLSRVFTLGKPKPSDSYSL